MMNLVKKHSQPTLLMVKLSLTAVRILSKIIHLVKGKASVQSKVSKTTKFICTTLSASELAKNR